MSFDHDDIINVSDLTDRFEELEDERDALDSDVTDATDALDDEDNETPRATLEANLSAAREALREWDEENGEEFETLREALDSLKGYGGDHKFRGEWYPATLVRDSYFVTYAQQFAEDIGAIPNDAAWPCTCIDWEQAARELQQDYSSVDIDGETYHYR